MRRRNAADHGQHLERLISGHGELARIPPTHASFLKAQLQGFAPTALAEGWMDQTTVEAVAAEFDAWAERPDTLYVETLCEAIGWVSD